jgi:hypothetical protein
MKRNLVFGFAGRVGVFDSTFPSIIDGNNKQNPEKMSRLNSVLVYYIVIPLQTSHMMANALRAGVVKVIQSLDDLPAPFSTLPKTRFIHLTDEPPGSQQKISRN